jgi:hypothetical protein
VGYTRALLAGSVSELEAVSLRLIDDRGRGLSPKRYMTLEAITVRGATGLDVAPAQSPGAARAASWRASLRAGGLAVTLLVA